MLRALATLPTKAVPSLCTSEWEGIEVERARSSARPVAPPRVCHEWSTAEGTVPRVRIGSVVGFRIVSDFYGEPWPGFSSFSFEV